MIHLQNINPKALESLMNMASKKLGVPPQELQKNLENGTFDKALSSMNPQDAQKLQAALSNPQLAQILLSTPQAKEIFQKLTGQNPK